MSRMRLILIWLLLFIPSGTVSGRQYYSEKWAECRKTQDCTAVKGICGWVCVHKHDADDAENYYEQIGSVFGCKKDPGDQPGAVCVENKCQCVAGSVQDDSTVEK